jgi:probable rRNA maturation factor
MSEYEIDVQVAPEFEERIEAEWVARVVQAALTAEGQPEETSVTVVIADDEALRTLNQSYRGLDEPTDVLSFSAREGEFVGPEDMPVYLGDVVISFPTAVAQAAEAGHSPEAELALLIVHGCLHLLGYDHAEEDEQARMWARQDVILSGLLS